MIDFSRLKIHRRIFALRRTIREIPALRSEIEELKQENLRLLDTLQQVTTDLRGMDARVDGTQMQLTAAQSQIRTSEERALSFDQRLAEFGRSVDQHPLFREAVALMQLYCQRSSMPSRSVILAAHPKCGNTFVRFLYHHLVAVANAGATQTMTYTHLNKVNPNHSFPDKFLFDGFTEPAEFEHAGFPLLLQSHGTWSAYWDTIGDVLLVERHPIDALISLWYVLVRFPERPREYIGIDDFVLRDLSDWVERFKCNAAHAKARIRYEDLVSNPYTTFATALDELGIAFDPAHLAQACEMSSFESVRAMEDARSEQHGHLADPVFRTVFSLGSWKVDPAIRFTRSGKTRQWRSELQPRTIAAARELLRQHDLQEFADELD